MWNANIRLNQTHCTMSAWCKYCRDLFSQGMCVCVCVLAFECVCLVCDYIIPHVYVLGCFTVAWKQISEMFGGASKLWIYSSFMKFSVVGCWTWGIVWNRWTILNKTLKIAFLRPRLLLWEEWQLIFIPGWQKLKSGESDLWRKHRLIYLLEVFKYERQSSHTLIIYLYKRTTGQTIGKWFFSFPLLLTKVMSYYYYAWFPFQFYFIF